MRILILGDFSSFGKNLRNGLIELGNEVDLISSGDSWKKINSDSINLDYSYKSIFERLYKGILNRKILFKISNRNKYDVILIMNQGFINFGNLKKELSLTFRLKTLKKMLNKNGKIYLSSCGTDKYYLEYAKKFYEKKGYYSRSFEEVEREKKQYYLSKSQEEKYLEIIEKVIPVAYDHAIPYKESIWNDKKKLYKIIPLCLDTKNIQSKNEIKDKIQIFHGVSRAKIKGSDVIIKAMENIKEKYPNKVEIKIVYNLPFDEYKKILEESNIILDQCKSIGYGMNTLYGMAMGKLVFSGNDIENEEELGLGKIPVVNINPNTKEIEERLEYFILNPELIISMGKEARKFTEKFHDNKVVAREYLKLFEENYKNIR